MLPVYKILSIVYVCYRVIAIILPIGTYINLTDKIIYDFKFPKVIHDKCIEPYAEIYKNIKIINHKAVIYIDTLESDSPRT